MKRNAFTLLELLIVIVILVILIGIVLPLGISYVFQTIFIFLFGWIPRTIWLLYRLTLDAPFTILVPIATFFVATGLLHFLLRFTRKDWKLRQSLAVTGLLLAAGTVLVGISTAFDEGRKIAQPKQPMRKSMTYLRRFRSSAGLLEKMGDSTTKFAEDHKQHLPMGGTLLEDGRPGHGWCTQLLPYMDTLTQETYSKIDLTKPWNDLANAEVYKSNEGNGGTWHPFRSGKDRYDFRDGKWHKPENFFLDEDGYQLTDYAANERVMWPGGSLRLDEITDGLSHTILIGEAAENLKPWGSPFNSRDPALGINRSPFGFGYAFPNEQVNFLMADGSVRSFSEKTDLEVLRALATPNGDEPVTEKEP